MLIYLELLTNLHIYFPSTKCNHEISPCSVEHCSHLCMTAAYFDISLLHIIYPILIGRESEREREREGLRNYVTLRCSLKRKNVAPSAGDGATKRRRRGRRGERCHYVKFGITTGFPAQIGVTRRRRSHHQKGAVRAGTLSGFGIDPVPCRRPRQFFPHKGAL